jgi:CubicO group peptidase (beta-lactamase class C family)
MNVSRTRRRLAAVVLAASLITGLTGITGITGTARTSGTAGVVPSGKPEDLGFPRLGAVPLDFQPGVQWRYSALAGIETLGRVVEIASGQTFDRFLRQRIFEPLGMKDTAFYPTERVPALSRDFENAVMQAIVE